jgi:ParB/RepB/Spo0J family partition protein
MKDGNMEIERVEIDRIQPHPRNVRQGDIGALIESLKAHGQYRPIVVQRSTGYILAGNHTWHASKQMKASHIQVVWADVDNDEAIRILLVDNRTNDLATYDDHELAHLLEALVMTPDRLHGTGYSPDDLDSLLALLNNESTEIEKEIEIEKDKSDRKQLTCPECGHEF